jgi:Domain of unknown function (DUF6285)
MRLKPDARNLLATALAAFRAELLPAMPAEKRYAALMIANALAMAERELGAREDALRAAAATLYPDIAALPADAFEQRLAADIEAGRFDAPDARREAAFAAVWAINTARLAITNPKRLAGE